MLLGGSVASSEALRSYFDLVAGQAMTVSEEQKLKQGMLRSVAGALLDPSREAAASKVTYSLPFGAKMTTLHNQMSFLAPLSNIRFVSIPGRSALSAVGSAITVCGLTLFYLTPLPLNLQAEELIKDLPLSKVRGAAASCFASFARRNPPQELTKADTPNLCETIAHQRLDTFDAIVFRASYLGERGGGL